MSHLVVGDIGGTHARFGLVRGRLLGDLEVLRNDEHPSFEALFASWLARHDPGPDALCCLAVAAPITGDVVSWTNRDWSFSASRLATRFGFRELRVMNDFEAVARSLPLLGPASTASIGGPGSGPLAPRIVLGPGTGLGLAALVPVGDSWVVLPTEAGHAGLTPGDAREREILDVIAAGRRLAAEPVLSGLGLVRIHDAIRVLDGRTVPPRTPEHVVERARDGTDPTCVETLEVFCRLLGRFAGDAALTLGARGGVYLASGICLALRPVLERGGFRAAFEDKATLPHYTAAIPTRLVLVEHPALIGAAAALGADAIDA